MFNHATKLVLFVLIMISLGLPPAQAEQPSTLNCTFTAQYPIVILRAGPGTTYNRVGMLRRGDTLQVIDQAAGTDGYLWWKGSNNQWVRSTLGSSDCPATCGNTICEYGETASSCASDCQNKNVVSTGTECLVEDAQACYESIDCYPNCNQCRAWLNDNGCVACRCDSSAAASTAATTSTSNATNSSSLQCTYASCEACIAAFPCYPHACTQNECHLNEYGCPVCQTAP
jgi:hypothetical protein